MLPEMVSLAATGAHALVQAAGSDAWVRISAQVANWLARGNEGHAQGELERLQLSAAAVVDAHGDERVVIRQEAIWQERMERALEALDDASRSNAAAELTSLIEAWRDSASAVTQTHGNVLSYGANAINAHTQIVNGNVNITPPLLPDQQQG